MTPPQTPPRPLRLADDPPPTPRRTLGELDDAAKATDARVVQMGSVVGTTAARLEALTHDHDDTANETLVEAKATHEAVERVERTLAMHGRAIEALAKSVESAWSELGLVKDNTTAIGGSIADLEAYLVVRDARTARKTALTTSSATGAVVVIVSVVLKLVFGV